MPGRDRTGPEGLGSMTGRRMGPCNGSNTTFVGRGYGRVLGRGYGRRFAYTPTKEDLQREKEDLQKRIEQIEEELE
ncbi:MAG: DUF5320 domain-containing protein [Candidatus Izimaplasma sp.]|nr:DUF5320 domain-containing protein [Candidatus Izimaplasma bacterium]